MNNFHNKTISDFNLKIHGPGPQYANRKIATAASLIILLLAKKKRKKCLKVKKGGKKMKRKNSKATQVMQSSKEMNTTGSTTLSSSNTVLAGEPSVPTNSTCLLVETESLQRELSLKDAELYRQCLRMDTNAFYELYNLIKPLVQRKDTVMRECISTTERLAITLRYLALGETQKTLADEFKIAQNTISGIIPDVCQALCSVLEKFLDTPSSEEAWRKEAHAFGRSWAFPWCLGALDGRTIKMTCYPKTDSASTKTKNEYPISLMTLVNADYKFIFADVDLCGHLYRDGHWEKSRLGGMVEKNSLNIPGPVSFLGTQKFIPYVFVGTDPFPLRSYIMKSYPVVGDFLDDAKRVFNYRVSRPQRVSDNTYGILLNRFQIYRHPLRSTLDKGRDIVIATVSLHNFLMSGSSRYGYSPPEMTDVEDVASGMFYPGQWREGTSSVGGVIPLQQGPAADSIYAEEVRNTFSHYFYTNPPIIGE